MLKKKKLPLLCAICVSTLSLGLATSVGAATLQLDFSTSFGDPLDTNTAAPDGPAPWLTAHFDDGGSAGSVTLTLTVAGTVGDASVTGVYLNVDDAISGLSINPAGGTGPTANNINIGTDAYIAGSGGLYDIEFDFPPPGSDLFTAGEILIYDIAATGLVASSFNFLSSPTDTSTGLFLAAAKFQSTGNGEQSDWVGAVPVPAAAWLFGSGLLGLAGIARRKRS